MIQRPPSQLKTSHLVSSLLMFLALCFTVYTAFADSIAPSQVDSLDKLRTQVERVMTELAIDTPQMKVSERMDRIGPSLILKMNRPLSGDTPKDRVAHFIRQYAQLWGRAHITIDEIKLRAGRTVATLSGSIDGLTILGQQSRLSIKEGRAQHLSNGIGALISVKRARVDEEKARATALKAMRARAQRISSARRAALPYEPGVALEVFELRFVDAVKMRTWVVLIDGRDGAVIQIRAGEVH